jgi:hypothetical protein
VSTVPPPQCIQAIDDDPPVLVSNEDCILAGLPEPPSTKGCNRFPCPRDQYTWKISEWGDCNTVTADCGTGTHSRVVVCVDGDGITALDSDCQRRVGEKPDDVEECDSGVACGCIVNSDCPQSTMQCSAAGKCECITGYGGSDCTIPLLTASLGASCENGIVDLAGTCCGGFVSTVTGLCCGEGAVVDLNGACCAPGVGVDACGVCGGTGVAVDVQGTCCKSPLPPSGLCCDADGVDSCGVCGGVNACPAIVSIALLPDVGRTPSVTALLLSEALGIRETFIADIQLSAASNGSSVRQCLCRQPVCCLLWLLLVYCIFVLELTSC